jgi:hypothetical protein
MAALTLPTLAKTNMRGDGCNIVIWLGCFEVAQKNAARH